MTIVRSMASADTTTEARAVQIEIYRDIGPDRRSATADRLSGQARALAVGGIRDRHPGWDDRQVLAELVRIMYGDELARAAFADDR